MIIKRGRDGEIEGVKVSYREEMEKRMDLRSLLALAMAFYSPLAP